MLKFYGKVHLNVALSNFFSSNACVHCAEPLTHRLFAAFTSNSLICLRLAISSSSKSLSSLWALILKLFNISAQCPSLSRTRTECERQPSPWLWSKLTRSLPRAFLSFLLERGTCESIFWNSTAAKVTWCRAIIHRAAAGGRTQAKYPAEGRDLLTTGHTLFAITKLPPLSVCEILRSVVAALCRGRLDTGSNPSDLYDYPQKSLANCVEGTGTCFSVRTSPLGSFTFLSFPFFFNTCKITPKFNITSTYSCYASLENISTDKKHNRLH